MYNITFQQIEAFLTVGRYLNMSRAAESLYISQPTLSKALQRFESGIGFQVFTRNNQGVALTPQGEYLLHALGSLYSNMEKAIRTAGGMTLGPKKTLRIVAPSSYDAVEDFNLLKRYVRDYAQRYPDVTLIEHLRDFRELQREFEFGETDIAFTQSFAIPDIKNVQYKYVSEYTLHLAMAEDHPLAAYDTIQPDKLSELDFYAVALQKEADSRALIMEYCGKHGFTPRRIELLDNFPTLLHVLREKRGVSICARFKLITPDNIKYYPLDMGDAHAYSAVVWYPDRLSKQAKDFIDMLPDNAPGKGSAG